MADSVWRMLEVEIGASDFWSSFWFISCRWLHVGESIINIIALLLQEFNNDHHDNSPNVPSFRTCFLFLGLGWSAFLKWRTGKQAPRFSYWVISGKWLNAAIPPVSYSIAYCTHTHAYIYIYICCAQIIHICTDRQIDRQIDR